MARKKKESFVMYHSQADAFLTMDDASAGRLIKAVFAKVLGLEVPELVGAEGMAYRFISGQIDRDSEKYYAACDIKRKAMERRWAKTSVDIYSGKQSSIDHPNNYRSSNDSVSVSESENESDTVSGSENESDPYITSCRVDSFGSDYIHGILPDTMIRTDATGQCGMVFSEVLEYGRLNGYRDDVVAEFWKTNEAHGWCVYGTPIRSWRAALDAWCKGTGTTADDTLPF